MDNKITKKLKVHIPLLPNFIRVGEQYVSIADFTEDELRDLGEEWTMELITKAKLKQRKK